MDECRKQFEEWYKENYSNYALTLRSGEGYENLDTELAFRSWTEAWNRRDRIIASLQAKIDEMMLEYCPEEMTPEQLAEYEKHQRALAVSEVMLDSFASCGEAVPEDDRKDAARYRFLRKDWFREDDAYSWLMSSECAFLESPDELDESIDKAIKEN